MRHAFWLALLCACDSDPAPGSEIDCTPTSAEAPIATAADDVPTDPAALQAWLIDGGYRSWAAESAPHRSSGPHARVRTFVNAPLVGSLIGCASPHPVGAAAVKELYRDDQLRGWAVMAKTRPEAGASSWYWYEVFSVAPDAEPAVAAQADVTCTGCHDGGLDAVRTRWPLQ
jgi:hypothetical protein